MYASQPHEHDDQNAQRFTRVASELPAIITETSAFPWILLVIVGMRVA